MSGGGRSFAVCSTSGSMPGRSRPEASSACSPAAALADMVAALLSEDRAPPVIIFQSDEGPFPESYGRGPWQEAPAADLAMKYGILTAIFVPGGDHGRFRQDMTAVNTYRLVFNTVFGTDFPELPDRIFAFPNDGNIYNFHDVTERLREDAPSG